MLQLGANAGSTGTYNLSGTGIVSYTGADGEYVGFGGNGNFNQTTSAPSLGTSVPEPACLVSVGLIAAGLFVRRRRHAKIG